MQSNEIGKKSFIPFIDGLRAIAAMYVVLCHMAMQFSFDFVTMSRLQRYTIYPFLYGHYAVNFFIVISGYSLSITMAKTGKYELKETVLSFYKKRFKRIVVPYFAALAISIILIKTMIGAQTGTHWDISLPLTYAGIITHLLLVHDLLNSTMFKINHAFWSISVEYRIYLFFPLLLAIWKKWGWLTTLISAVAISIICLLTTACLYYCAGVDVSIGLDGINPYIILFVFGMLAARITLGIQENTVLKRTMKWAIIPITLLIFLLQKAANNSSWIYWFEVIDVLWGILAICLIVSINDSYIIKNIISSRALVYLGTFSYSIYLIHAPLVQLIWQYVISPLNLSNLHAYWLLLLLGIPMIIAASYVFYVLCERPFMSHKKPLKQF